MILKKIFFYLLIISFLLPSDIHAVKKIPKSERDNQIVYKQGTYHAKKLKNTNLKPAFNNKARPLQFKGNAGILMQFLLITTIIDQVIPPINSSNYSSYIKSYNDDLTIYQQDKSSINPYFSSDCISNQNKIENAYRQEEVCEPKTFIAISALPYTPHLQEVDKQGEIINANFTFENSGKLTGYSFESMTDLAKDIASSGFQTFTLEQDHRNDTCSVLSIPFEEDYNPCSPSNSLFSSELQLPSEYCLAFAEAEIDRLSLKMVNKLREAFSHSNGKPFGIIVGENHEKISDFLLELILLNLAHSMGINHLLLECPSDSYEEIERDALASSFTAFDTPLLYKKIIFAKYLGMEIIPIDLHNRSRDLVSKEGCGQMQEVFNEKREVSLCQNTLDHRNNFITFLGHYHPSYFSNRCEGIDEAYALSYIHLQPKSSKERDRSGLELLNKCRDEYINQRFRESISVLKDKKVIKISLKANKLLDPEVFFNLYKLGIIKKSEIPEEFLK